MGLRFIGYDVTKPNGPEEGGGVAREQEALYMPLLNKLPTLST